MGRKKKRKLTLEEKVKKEIMTDIRLKRIPRSDNKIRPIFHTCGRCHKNPVTHHHYLCDKCHAEKNGYKINKGKNKGKQHRR